MEKIIKGLGKEGRKQWMDHQSTSPSGHFPALDWGLPGKTQ